MTIPSDTKPVKQPDLESRDLTVKQRLQCAHAHYVRKMPQMDLAELFDVNGGRVSEACTAIHLAASNPKLARKKMEAPLADIEEVTRLNTIISVMNAVSRHQVMPGIHPLTCGSDSSHRHLYPVCEGGKVKMLCCDCDYVQDNAGPYSQGEL